MCGPRVKCHEEPKVGQIIGRLIRKYKAGQRARGRSHSFWLGGLDRTSQKRWALRWALKDELESTEQKRKALTKPKSNFYFNYFFLREREST